MCLRTISNSIVPKPRHFFVRGRRPRTKKCRGWGTILLDIERKHTVYPIYTPFSGGIYLLLLYSDAKCKKKIKWLVRIELESYARGFVTLPSCHEINVFQNLVTFNFFKNLVWGTPIFFFEKKKEKNLFLILFCFWLKKNL